MATIRSESSTLQYIAVTAQSGQVNLTSDHHPLLSPESNAQKPLQLLVPHLVPHLDMRATSKVETTLRNSLLVSAALLTHNHPGGVALGSVCFTQRLSMSFVGLGGGRQRKQAGLFKELHRPVPPDHFFPLHALLCSGWLAGSHGRQLQSEVRIGLHGPLQAPTRRRPQRGVPSSCCRANLKPWLP